MVAQILALLMLSAAAHGGILQNNFRGVPGADGYPIPLRLTAIGDLRIDLYSPDNDLVASLQRKDAAAGEQVLYWDGNDSNGQPVPAEAYIPVVTVHYADGKKVLDDPRSYSGGEVIETIPSRLQRDHSVQFDLPHPARVLVRAGIASGPLMKTLANWQPRPTGSNIVRWDGFDHDRVVDLRQDDRLRILVTGYRLPEHVILVVGDQRPAYADYRAKRNQPPAAGGRRSSANLPTERKGIRLSPFYFHPRSQDIEPRITATFSGSVERSKDGVAMLRGPTPVQVDMHQEDQIVLDETLYEIAFFADLKFVSEQEQGYVPMTWIFDPSQYAPGRHTLTVNVSAFRGQVGVTTLAFEVPPPTN